MTPAKAEATYWLHLQTLHDRLLDGQGGADGHSQHNSLDKVGPRLKQADSMLKVSVSLV